jgi:hypothetical protein
LGSIGLPSNGERRRFATVIRDPDVSPVVTHVLKRMRSR